MLRSEQRASFSRLTAEGSGRTRDLPTGVTTPFGYLDHMATVTRTFLVDDLDGSTEDVQNVRISLDGTNFEMDLSATNATRLREKLAKYVEHGTRVTPQRTRRLQRVVKPLSGRDRSRCGTGHGRTGTRCRPAGASPRPSRTPSPPPTDPGPPLSLKRFT